MFSLHRKLGRAFCHPLPRENLSRHGIFTRNVFRNLTPAKYYEIALNTLPANPTTSPSCFSNTGAFAAYSGEKTGRVPQDKRIVRPLTKEEDDKVWWGHVNKPMERNKFELVLQRAIDYLNNRERLFVIDGFISWDPKYRKTVRVFTTRPYHAIFMHNMLIRPTDEELRKCFEKPDFVIYNAGEFYAEKGTTVGDSRTCVALDFSEGRAAILGTQYAGEMKKGLFSLMHYLMPDQGVLSLHSSATEGKDGDVTLMLGLSGTGKTTLSHDPNRTFIGDDETLWTHTGIANIEGGSYAKCHRLNYEDEPLVYQAVKFGAVLENVRFTDPHRRIVDFNDTSITQNTRVSYPLEYLPNAKIPAVAGHPKNIVFLTSDANGVMPPVSKLNHEQAIYHFLSGYTATMAGVLSGNENTTATFSSCFGEIFLSRHPWTYAELLSKKIAKHKPNVWLVNTGWINGKFGVGQRIPMKFSRAIIDAINSGELEKAEFENYPIFNFKIPKGVTGVPSEILDPSRSWKDKAGFQASINELAEKFNKNFEKYSGKVPKEFIAGGPRVDARPTSATR